jgi:20S proteasome alpha/beta subunit
MTLVAAFRCRNSGVLLCADRKEDDGVAIKDVDKIQHTGFRQFELFMAGAGTTTTVKDAWTEITQELYKANFDKERNVLMEHRSLIEAGLKTIHEKHEGDLKYAPLSLLVVVAPYQHQRNSIPILYQTDRTTLLEETEYIARGTGQTLSDYFAGYLYKHGLPDDRLAVLASFILKEAEKYASGVGSGSDMYFIHPGGIRKELHTDSTRKIQAGIPPLADAIHSYWSEHFKPPLWLKDYAG